MTLKPLHALPRLVHILAGATLLLASGVLQAQVYRIDAIVFLDRHAATEGGQPLPGRPLLNRIAVDDAEALQAARITLLPEDDFALTQQWNRLRNAQRYQRREPILGRQGSDHTEDQDQAV